MTPTIQQVREAYASADKSAKMVLESLYGRPALCSITDQIKTPKDAFTFLGIDYNDPQLNGPERFQKGLIAFHRLQVIVEALNEGWKPDWTDSNQQKWWPWFGFRGGRFVFRSVDFNFTHSGLGSRLCFRTAELAKYAGTQFEDLYNEFMILG